MATEGKTGVGQIFRIGGREYELREVDGPVERGGDVFPAQFDHAAGVLLLSRAVPVEQRAWVVAVAVSDACFRLWRPVPVIWPDWEPADRTAASTAGAAGGRGRRPGRPSPLPGPAGGPRRP